MLYTEIFQWWMRKESLIDKLRRLWQYGINKFSKIFPVFYFPSYPFPGFFLFFFSLSLSLVLYFCFTSIMGYDNQAEHTQEESNVSISGVSHPSDLSTNGCEPPEKLTLINQHARTFPNRHLYWTMDMDGHTTKQTSR